MNVKALIIKASREIEVKEIDLVSSDSDREASDASLEALQEIVGGPLEGLYGEGWSGFCDEEGKLQDEPAWNPLATDLLGQFGWTGAGADVLAGDVIVFGPVEAGEDEDVYQDVPQWLVEAAQMMATA